MTPFSLCNSVGQEAVGFLSPGLTESLFSPTFQKNLQFGEGLGWGGDKNPSSVFHPNIVLILGSPPSPKSPDSLKPKPLKPTLSYPSDTMNLELIASMHGKKKEEMVEGKKVEIGC